MFNIKAIFKFKVFYKLIRTDSGADKV